MYGALVQIHDDLTDCLAVPANPDWVQGRSPLPILFAREVDHPGRERFRHLCRMVDDPAALDEAQTILIRCGAVSYCLDQLLTRHERALQLVHALPLRRPDEIVGLLNTLAEPAEALLRLAA